jgi:hypothetical protein
LSTSPQTFQNLSDAALSLFANAWQPNRVRYCKAATFEDSIAYLFMLSHVAASRAVHFRSPKFIRRMYSVDPLAHASIGLMAKPIAPKAPLWALVAATQVPDLLSFGFMAAGIEHGADTSLDFEHGLRYLSQASIHWSHGLLMCTVWSVAVAAITYVFSRNRRTSIVMGLLVLSHWVLDFTVYPNLPLLLDDSSLAGLGLITSGPGLILGIILEFVLIGGGIATYWVTRRRLQHS